MKARVYPTEGGFVVADDSGWLPGVYQTPEAAQAAATLPLEALDRLSRQHLTITASALRQAQQQITEEQTAREALDDAISAADDARLRLNGVESLYMLAGANGVASEDLARARSDYALACRDVDEAGTAERQAQEALDKILEAHAALDPEHVTYSEGQIRAAFESLGGMDALTGYHTLMTALGKRSRTTVSEEIYRGTPHVPGKPWPPPSDTRGVER